MLEARQLCAALGGRRIVHPADLCLNRGEVVGLIGANGSGKSTLLRALAGLIPLESGGVCLGGKPLREIPLAEVAQAMAYLPQSPECHWPLTVESVVALGRLPFRASSREIDEPHIVSALQAVDALHLRGRAVNQLSGGERACVFLARALASNPTFLLIDEPAAGLDPYHRLRLMELLRALAREGRGILVVLHDLGLAARFCERLLLLNDGSLVASGSPEEVLSDPLLAGTHHVKVFRASHESAPVIVPWACVSGHSRVQEDTPKVSSS